MSSNQLHRILGITLKSAWFLSHRIREAMKPTSKEPPMGGRGEIIESDETYLGSGGFEFVNDEGWKAKRGVGDAMRADKALKGIAGKRLTYKAAGR